MRLLKAFSILFLLVFVHRALGQTNLFLNQSTEPIRLEAGKANHYSIQVPSNFEAGKNYLIFDVVGTEDAGYDPDIFISNVFFSFAIFLKTTVNPTISQNEWKCTAYGQDICVVPKEAITPGKTFWASNFSIG